MERKLRAVLFDMGGTLFTYERLPATTAIMARELNEQLRLDPAEIERIVEAIRAGMARALQQWTVQPFYLLRDVIAEGYTHAAAAFGKTLAPTDGYRLAAMAGDVMMRDLSLRKGTIETLQALRKRGLHVGVVSNADEDQLEQGLATEHVADYLDSILCSETARSCKPDSEIFKQALRRANCQAEEALFVGDSPQQDIAGAAGVGMRTALIIEDTITALRRDMAPFPSDYVIHEIPEVLGLVDRL